LTCINERLGKPAPPIGGSLSTREEIMKAKDVMTTNVVTVGPEMAVDEVAKKLLAHGISGVPVVAADGRILGMVSEGDLVRRAETGTQRQRSWWLRVFADNATLATDYAKAHGRTAQDVMATEVVSVEPSTSLAEIADLLEQRRIKRVPVVDGGKLVGIISRANLVRALVAAGTMPATADSDTVIRDALSAALKTQPWATVGKSNIVVKDGIVHLWGLVQSDAERRALRVAAENIPGVRGVKDHLSVEIHYAPM
jgi:CBS domain-containing protein